MAAPPQFARKRRDVLVDVVRLRPGERRHESYTHALDVMAELELEHHLVLADDDRRRRARGARRQPDPPPGG